MNAGLLPDPAPAGSAPPRDMIDYPCPRCGYKMPLENKTDAWVCPSCDLWNMALPKKKAPII